MSTYEVSAWQAIVPEPGGRDERKVWLSRRAEAPREDWWLWKPCKSTEGGVRSLSDVSEVVAHRLAVAIDLPAARYELAVRDGVRGAISRNVSPHDVEMNDGQVWGVREDDYSVSRIFEVLDGVSGPPPRHDVYTAAEVFTGYLVLDAWIANTDRHARNWAVIEPPNGRTYLAPTFDHGSALGSGLVDHRREATDVTQFCRRGRSRPFGKAGLVDLAAEATTLSGASWWAERVAAVDNQTWIGVLEEVEGLSEVACSFVDDILRINQERVSSACRR